MLYLGRNSRQLGPYTREQVIALVQAGKVLHGDIAWHEGMQAWAPINEVFDRLEIPLPACAGGTAPGAVPARPDTGYFAALTNSSFKQDSQGRTVFFPWGILGRGRVVPDAAAESGLRSFLQTYYLVMIVAVVTTQIAFGKLYPLLLLPVLCGWYYLVIARTAWRYPYADTTLSLREAYTNQAATHHKTTLWLLLIASLLFALGGLMLALASQQTGGQLAGALCTILFGLSAAAIGFMLSARK